MHVCRTCGYSVCYSPSGNVESYLSLMDRLHTAVEFFQQSNPGSVELGSVVRAWACVLCYDVCVSNNHCMLYC